MCLALALFAAVAPARAEEAETASASVTLIAPLTLTKLQDMDFGSVWTDGSAGTVLMTPSIAATCTPTGTLGHTGDCQYAEFAGYGSAGQQIRIKLPGGNKIVLTGPGADMAVTAMTVDGSPEITRIGNGEGKGNVKYRIDAPDGGFSFRIGGTLNVNAGQAPGLYTGLFEVRIEYD